MILQMGPIGGEFFRRTWHLNHGLQQIVSPQSRRTVPNHQPDVEHSVFREQRAGTCQQPNNHHTRRSPRPSHQRARRSRRQTGSIITMRRAHLKGRQRQSMLVCINPCEVVRNTGRHPRTNPMSKGDQRNRDKKKHTWWSECKVSQAGNCTAICAQSMTHAPP